jgi:hypothetical protein
VFWASGFWTPGFWQDNFWEGLTTESVEGDGATGAASLVRSRTRLRRYSDPVVELQVKPKEPVPVMARVAVPQRSDEEILLSALARLLD